MTDQERSVDTGLQPVLSTDQALSLLSDSRRRRLLIELADRQPDAEIEIDSDTLEQELLRTQNGLRLPNVDVDSIIISMHHNHLPRLAEFDVIEWNERDDTVKPGPAFNTIKPFIEYLDRHQAELPSDWRYIQGTDNG